ncbi:MAG: hypothetical protein IKF99_09695 [Oscillospiraceae bacterium]|nr:hypothetical protein [Oscillospiraceae bacterium]
MTEVVVNGQAVEPEIDEKQRVMAEVTDTIHSAGRITETAIMSDDPKVKEALKASVRVLLDTAMTKLDESVGASVADAQDPDEEDD